MVILQKKEEVLVSHKNDYFTGKRQLDSTMLYQIYTPINNITVEEIDRTFAQCINNVKKRNKNLIMSFHDND